MSRTIALVACVSRKHDRPKRPRTRLTRPEYQALGLDVLDYWKRRPPILRCQACGAEWRAWDWRCANGCNAARDLPPKQIANPELRAARVRAGLTIGDLAVRVGVHPSMVSQWELRGSLPDPDLRRRLADLLGASFWPDEEPDP